MATDPTGVVAVVGDVLVDVVVRPTGAVAPGSDTDSTITWRQGGAAANTAVQLAALGTPVRLVGRIGDDGAGRWLAADLAEAGVDAWLAVDHYRPTGTVVALVHPGERDMFTSRGASAALSPDDLAVGWLEGIAHLHLSGYALLDEGTRPAGLAALAAGATAGLGLSVDPASAGPLREVGAATFVGWLPPGVLLTPNLDEARLLTGLADPEAAAVGLAARCGEVVVTLGVEGAVWSNGRSVRRCGVPTAAEEGDPVGAGDAFTAGLLSARLSGASIEAQLAAGCAAGGRAVGRSAPGGHDPHARRP